MSTRTAPRYSTRELQAAAQALAAGHFGPDSVAPSDAGRAVVLDETAIVDAQHRDTTAPEARWDDTTTIPGLAPLVRVRAACAGAGASTVALALAEVADIGGLRVRMLDAAAPAWSGLVGATATELGAADGWRRGRRGQGMIIDRVDDAVRFPTEIPSPRFAEGVDLTVLDAGWSMRELVASEARGWVAAAPADAEVLVTRQSALSLSQTEAALTHLEDRVEADLVLVVVVGAGRGNGRELATAGRLLRRAHEHGAVLFAPLLSAKTLPGLGPHPLPKQLTNPSQRLLERIFAITRPLTANRT